MPWYPHGCVITVCECMVNDVKWVLNDKFGAVWSAYVACEHKSFHLPLAPSLIVMLYHCVVFSHRAT